MSNYRNWKKRRRYKKRKKTHLPDELKDDLFGNCCIPSSFSGRALQTEKEENDLKEYGRWKDKPVDEFVRKRREEKRKVRNEHNKPSLFIWAKETGRNIYKKEESKKSKPKLEEPPW